MSQAEKLTSRMFRRSLILKIIAAVFLLFIVICVAIYIYDGHTSSIVQKLDWGAGMQETLRELEPSTKVIPPFEVEYKGGWNKSLIRVKSNQPSYYISRALSKIEEGDSNHSLHEYPDIDAYIYVAASGYVTHESTIRHCLFGEWAMEGYWRAQFEKWDSDLESLELPKYRYYMMIEIQKESDDAYWIYMEMNNPSFAPDVMKEAIRQINAFDETDG